MAKFRKSIGYLTAVLMVIFSFCQSALAAGHMLVPVGDVVGISLETEGVLVVGFPDEDTSPAKAAGIKPGDLIIGINDTVIKNGFDIGDFKLSADPITVTVMRGGTEKQINVTPGINQYGEPELGLWLRDSLSGIGTVTFYDPETGMFGALGHSVNDIDTGVIVPVGNGVLADAKVTDVVEGRCGFPGQLNGVFDFNSVVGVINDNTVCGIFGTVTDKSAIENTAAIETAAAEEVHTGSATIISCVDSGGPCEYDVEITRVEIDNKDGHSFVIEVTDEKLIETTGGIVQGMSGSPIIQDGKLVGAVTHVLVNDPARGYGIFIENMLEAAG